MLRHLARPHRRVCDHSVVICSRDSHMDDTSTLQVSSTAQGSYLDSPFLDPFAVDDVGTAPPPREGTGQVAVITDLQSLPTVRLLLP